MTSPQPVVPGTPVSQETGWQQYESLFEEAPIAYHEIDADGTITRVNRAECEFLGFSRTEMIGQPIWNFVALHEREISRTAVMEKLAETRRLMPFEREYAPRNKAVRLVEIHENLIRDKTGNVVGLRSAMLDITDRKATEQAALAAQRWIEATLRCIADGAISADAAGCVKFINASGEEITGWSSADALDQDVEQVFHVVDSETRLPVEMSLRRLIEEGATFRSAGKQILVRKDGSELAVEYSRAPVTDDRGDVMGAVLVFRRTL